ncbi:siderophore-interacting protein [Puniceibacterium sediminis]|uniref:NADPH-dependent ferric siderophore reductase, contains FAD-binding and SIP domains n=1 Tax=Puniceibacterium sediminis TaxID=1608407 RepID=A0A238WA89_9RHOB|nr:siderophore-interacting protein [Puniceibacterium sediminis]SNR43496.1 NADPH-dependent ferric siderophore reductase, contains FAD-binding and SIP domains [Puniceibacterium sediminis]
MNELSCRFSRTSVTRFNGPIADGFLAGCVAHLQEFDLPVTVTHIGVMVELPMAQTTVDCDGPGFCVTLCARDDVALHQARENLLYMIDRVQPGISQHLRWSGDIARTGAPPNFYGAEVVTVRQLGPRFLRVELDCAGTAALAAGPGMHFSLLLAPDGRAPVWPRINGNGRTVWPAGDDCLHRAVYTFVDLDPVAGRFTFDVFEHDGGRTTDWARTARPGAAVGIMGPGGGDMPVGDDLLIAGDETALPAISRILGQSDPTRRGRAIIEVADETSVSLIPAPEGVSITWVLRDRGETLWDHLSDADLPGAGGNGFVWVAAERDVARRAKSHFRETLGQPADRSYFSAYWIR